MKRSALPQAVISLPCWGLDLDSTLTSGQSFSWQKTAARWKGWIQGQPVVVWTEGETLCASARHLTPQAVARYFGLDLPLEEIFATFPAEDPWLQRARAFAPGLRVLRQEPWETLCNFICSSLKQIVQIEQINRELRRTFGLHLGEEIYTFPAAARLAQAEELELRACKLGFRARHLFVAARQIAAGEVSLEHVATLPTNEAREELRRIRGVGAKVANCILLFAYGRLDAFPIDVWVERVLRQLYFAGRPRVKHERLLRFADRHFGVNRGYAQQFLFHWIRKDPLAMPEQRPVAKKRTTVAKRRAALLKG